MVLKTLTILVVLKTLTILVVLKTLTILVVLKTGLHFFYVSNGCEVLSVENIASEFGVGRSTVGDIKKSEGKLRSFASSMEGMKDSSKKKKVMHLAEDEKLEEAIYLWFLQKRAQDMPMSGPMLCEKAM